MNTPNPKNKLAYSKLGDTIYYFDENGVKHEIHQSFIQAMLLWINEGELPEVGSTNARELTHKNKVHWRITCERVNE